MDLEQIKKALNSGSGRALKRYLLTRLYELRDIENVKDVDNPEHQALETKAQKRAYLKLKEIYDEILTFEEQSREKDPRDSYDVQ